MSIPLKLLSTPILEGYSKCWEDLREGGWGCELEGGVQKTQKLKHLVLWSLGCFGCDGPQNDPKHGKNLWNNPPQKCPNCSAGLIVGGSIFGIP